MNLIEYNNIEIIITNSGEHLDGIGALITNGIKFVKAGSEGTRE